MQPASIKRFETFYLAAWGVALILAFLGWNADPRLMKALGFVGLLAANVVVALIPLSLCYFASRKRSNIARWLIVILFVLQAYIVFRMLTMGGFSQGFMGALQLIMFVLRAIAVRYLFGPEASEWFGNKPTAVAAASAAEPTG